MIDSDAQLWEPSARHAGPTAGTQVRFVCQTRASQRGAPPLGKSVISRAVTVAGGRFAPGHLGEGTQQVPFEMAEAATGPPRRGASRSAQLHKPMTF